MHVSILSVIGNLSAELKHFVLERALCGTGVKQSLEHEKMAA
jgi:hypothetical protein